MPYFFYWILVINIIKSILVNVLCNNSFCAFYPDLELHWVLHQNIEFDGLAMVLAPICILKQIDQDQSDLFLFYFSTWLLIASSNLSSFFFHDHLIQPNQVSHMTFIRPMSDHLFSVVVCPSVPVLIFIFICSFYLVSRSNMTVFFQPGIFEISDEDRLHSFSESYKLGINLIKGNDKIWIWFQVLCLGTIYDIILYYIF